MKKLLQGFILSISFFTPLPIKSKYTKENVSYMIYFLPIVGLFSGSVIYLFSCWIIGSFSHLMLFMQILGVIILLILDHYTNNFLHIDGYCDTVDALYFEKKGKERLHILKEPHLGMYAVVWLNILLIIKFIVFYFYMYYTKNGNKDILNILLVYPVLGYLCVPYLAYFLNPLFQKSLGADLKKITGKKHILLNTLVTIFITILICGSFGLITTLITVSLIFLLLYYFKYKFKGYNGDVMGFCIEIIRICVLISGIIGAEVSVLIK